MAVGFLFEKCCAPIAAFSPPLLVNQSVDLLPIRPCGQLSFITAGLVLDSIQGPPPLSVSLGLSSWCRVRQTLFAKRSEWASKRSSRCQHPVASSITFWLTGRERDCLMSAKLGDLEAFSFPCRAYWRKVLGAGSCFANWVCARVYK